MRWRTQSSFFPRARAPQKAPPGYNDLGGFAKLGRIGGDLTVSDNDRLRPCQAERLRDDVGIANIDGAITISNNGQVIEFDGSRFRFLMREAPSGPAHVDGKVGLALTIQSCEGPSECEVDFEQAFEGVSVTVVP